MPARKKNNASPSSSVDDDDYRKKRERNNLAVKKCRIKSNEKAKETKDRIDKLKRDNLKLEVEIEELQKRVKDLKDLILKSNPTGPEKEKLDEILAEDDD